MLEFTFFDSYEWEALSNDAEVNALRAKIKALECEIEMDNAAADVMQNKIATLEEDNAILRASNEKLKTIVKSNSDYISELEERERKGVISLSSELNTKVENQRKQIYYLEKKIDCQAKVIVEKEGVISEKNTQLANANKKIDELIEGIRTSDDKTWKQKYDSLVISTTEVAKKCEMYRNIALRNKKENHDKDIALSKIDDIIKETGYKKG